MTRVMCAIGIIVAILLVIVFGLDAFLKVPFGAVNMTIDVAMIISGLMLGYAGWATLREQK